MAKILQHREVRSKCLKWGALQLLGFKLCALIEIFSIITHKCNKPIAMRISSELRVQGALKVANQGETQYQEPNSQEQMSAMARETNHLVLQYKEAYRGLYT